MSKFQETISDIYYYAKSERMGNKYTVVGNFRQPHKDCEGETLTDLSFEEVMKIESEWKKEKKYKEVFHFKQS